MGNIQLAPGRTRDNSALRHFSTVHGSEVSGRFGTSTDVSKRHFGTGAELSSPVVRTFPPFGLKWLTLVLG